MSSYLWINDHNDQSQINQYNNQIAQSNMNACAPIPSSGGSIDYGSTSTVVTGGGGGGSGYNATCDNNQRIWWVFLACLIIVGIIMLIIYMVNNP